MHRQSNDRGWPLTLAICLGTLTFVGCRSETTVPETPTTTAPATQEYAAPAANDRLVVEGLIFTVPEAELADRKAEVRGLKVTQVLSDKLFLVTNASGEPAAPLLVYLDEVPTPGTPTEGRYDVTAGQVLRVVDGTFNGMTDATLSEWKVPEDVRKQVGQRPVYLHANELEIMKKADAGTPNDASK